MYDMDTLIDDSRTQANDSEGYMAALAHWSPRVARRIADEEGLVLSEEHWQVIYCLREWFRDIGPEWTARDLTRRLEHEYADVGGRRYLYGLFPHGPLVQGCRVAGLPLPHGTLNASFGSVH
jgi:TusE/DsrC/DsvC family sulfur relay protein